MEGVQLHKLNIIETPKGRIFHALKANDIGFCGFGEAYFSEVKYKCIKGWNRHNIYTLNIVVIKGCVKFVIFDDRKDSKTNAKFIEHILSPKDNYARLSITPGLWVAFEGLAEDGSILLDIIPDEHNPQESDKKDINEIKYQF